MIRIDGSFGEGGGQILRTSLSLSLATGKPFRIEKIRARRERGGLLRQHLTAVLAAAEIGGATVEGAALGSTELTFTPGKIRAGEYKFTIGTAGSGTLVFQTVLAPLLLADGPSRLVFEGGTHNQSAPTFDYMARVFAPLVERMGPKIALTLERYGFYPAGGGRFVAEVTPCTRWSQLTLSERGKTTSRKIRAVSANLPRNIARRECETASARLNWDAETCFVEETNLAACAGNVVMVEVGSAELTEMFTGFGQLGVPAEKVADTAAYEAREYLASRAAAGEHLTDQLLLPMALAGGGEFTGVRLNMHARTNMAVIRQFLPVQFVAEEEVGFTRVRVLAA